MARPDTFFGEEIAHKKIRSWGLPRRKNIEIGQIPLQLNGILQHFSYTECSNRPNHLETLKKKILDKPDYKLSKWESTCTLQTVALLRSLIAWGCIFFFNDLDSQMSSNQLDTSAHEGSRCGCRGRFSSQ